MKRKLKLNKIVEKYKYYIFIGILLILYFLFDFFAIAFREPYGIHFIRQTDSLSFVANYYRHGFHFFEPQIFHLQSIDGKTACEFPILYYLTALSYLIFGEHSFILRIITLTISTVGFIYLFKLTHLFIKDILISLPLSLMICSSSVLLYYSNNYLPDASVFGLTIMAWYHYFKFTNLSGNQKNLYYSILFFFFASIIKITYLINPIAAILSLIVVSYQKQKSIKAVFFEYRKILLYSVFLFLLILSWNIYQWWYNYIHQASYFLVKPNPIWDLNQSEAWEVWGYMKNYWFSQYYYQTAFHFFMVLIFLSFFFKNGDKTLKINSIFLFIGSISYFLFFYIQFKNHDYYFIAFIPLLILLSIQAFLKLKTRFSKQISSIYFKIFLLLLCVLSFKHSGKKLSERFDTNRSDLFAEISKKLEHTKEFLDKKNIPIDAKFIIYTDLTPNGGLYWIKRPGWNIEENTEKGKSFLKSYLQKDAAYIIFTDSSLIINEIVAKKIGIENKNYIFKLKKDYLYEGF